MKFKRLIGALTASIMLFTSLNELILVYTGEFANADSFFIADI